jgi:uncharacterized glyoxalase superfamily protein PhnB
MTLGQLDIVANDILKSVAFYRALGVRIPQKSIWRTKTGAHHIDIELPNGFSLHLDSPALARVYNKGYRGKGAGGNLVIGFSLATRRAVDAAYVKLTKAGHEGVSPPWDAFWGARNAIVADPDGNHVGIMSPSDPKKRWPGPEL